MIAALINQKGGVGKTTSVINIGAGLARAGKRTMVVDLDPQAHLTYSLGIRSHELEKSIYELLKGEASLSDVQVERYGLSVIPATLDLSGAEVELAGEAGREFLLRESLTDARDFDYVLLDCPPSLGLLSLNALTAANEVYIPLQTEFLALQGMSKLIETIEKVRHRINKNIEVTGIIATQFDSRKVLNREVVDKIREHFGEKVFKTCIRDNVALAEAPSFGQTIFEYKESSNGAQDYSDLCKEIIARGQN
jgi:chromosome partitioning protein